MRSLVKTTGSRGLHVYVPIVRGPSQKEVWTFAKAFALELAGAQPELMTAEYRVAKRPRGRVLVDYNQNALGAARWRRSTRSARSRARRFDARDLGGDREGRRASRTSGSTTSGARIAKRRRPLGAAAAARGRFDLGTFV